MSDIAEELKYNGHTILIKYDNEEIENPREWDNMGTMVCKHRRYNLGDKNNYRSENYNSIQELEADIYKNENPVVCLPLYLFDHSGISMSTRGFNNAWDSGQVGFIFVSREKALKEYNTKRITKKIKEQIKDSLLAEVETYDLYLRCECYGYEIIDNQGNEIDSCGGFLGDIKYCIEVAKENTPTTYMEQLELAF